MNRVLVQADVGNLDLQSPNLFVGYGSLLQTPPVTRQNHVPDLLHILSALSHVHNHIVRLVDAPDSTSLISLPPNLPKGAGHLGLVAVLTNLAALHQLDNCIL